MPKSPSSEREPFMNDEQTPEKIVQETRRTKEALAKPLGFDVDRILDEAKNGQEKSGRKIIPAPISRKNHA